MRLDMALFFIGLVGVLLGTIFMRIGALVGPDGMLQEPFFLVPLSYLLMAVGFGGVLVRILWHRLRHPDDEQ